MVATKASYFVGVDSSRTEMPSIRCSARSSNTSFVTVRNNVVFRNHIVGLAMGGYDRNRGATFGCEVSGNTFFDHNLYFALGPIGWQWKTEEFDDFDSYRDASGNDSDSIETDPQFINPAEANFNSTLDFISDEPRVGAAEAIVEKARN